MGLNGILATARQTLEVFTAGVQIAGQNISNASTPGYIREELLLEPGFNYRSGSLILGTGVRAVGVQQQIDQYLEFRIHGANAEVATAAAKELTYKQLEGEVQELGTSDISTALTDFFDALSDLATQPESVPYRDLVVRQGTELSRDFRALHQRVDDLRLAKTVEIEKLVTEANDLIREVNDLNKKIVQLESAGLIESDAGAARSQRYDALKRLSEILPIQYREQANGSVDVFTESDYLVLSGTIQQLEIDTSGYSGASYRVELSTTGHDIGRAGGALRGLIESREDILGGFLNQLDELASSLIFEFNRLHASGEGLSGFTSLASAQRVLDPNLPLSQADNGLTFLPEHGSFEISVVNRQTGLRETTTISVDLDGLGTEATLEDIRAALEAVPNLSAAFTTRGELEITAASGYEFRFGNDSSGLLAAMGMNAFFTGTDASDIDVSNVIASNSDYLATGQGGGPADGRNAVRYTEFFENPLGGLQGQSLTGFYEQTIAQLAQDSASESELVSAFSTFRDSLVNQQQQFTGVSLDEEAIKVLEFQRGYQAAARIVSTVNQLFDVLVNL